ncbi:sodium:solute symporter [Algibacter amylolyticus]|uniref:Sodium:solute symporter n=1 Tax=Algibacter amylolyticus TaxID=1608400 RepID=A0A5M7BAA3_9FLAO|nr:sodium:solute symporter [Algibacter amylolyticus]KAA5824474.1 sodium:solute symporter [Algibacter amylolyticus]MBB5269466.1 Na+/proline symporter [Algibacter amylolyticus]TSJ75247.1 sodium:solute symporter [Algibacter amylolyticus]
MTATQIMLLIAAYFVVLILISYFTGKEDSNEAFFKANKSAPWYLVAFGMIGASLSGVTFISVPGMIEGQQFAYMQGVLGFFVGYLFILFVLLPIYYKLNVTSIYQYLEQRFGVISYKTGAFFFLLSRVTGASFRLFLVALAMQYIVFEDIGVPFWATVVISILLIWIYTNRGGIKTIVWTDTLQTLAMLTSVSVAIFLITDKLDWTYVEFLNSPEFSAKGKIFFFDDPNATTYFWKYFIGGIFIAIAMTGLDQDMMQKNLTCKTPTEAKKNMFTMATLLIFVNFFFLSLGALLFIYADKFGLQVPVVDGRVRTDLLFPEIAMNQNLGTALSVTFIIGLIAAAYSSADSALTSLTTSFSVDFLNIEKLPKEAQKPLRKKVHIGVSILLIIVVIIFNSLEGNVVSNLFKFATFTYGPLLGLFAFGIITNYQIKDKYVWLVGLASILITFTITSLPESVIGSYKFHWEILPINGLITFLGLILIRRK